MLKQMVVLVLIGAVVAPVLAQETKAPTSCRVYFVGNSVTDTINYRGLAELAKSRGHNQVWGRHMIPGAPLQWIWQHPKDGFQEQPFGPYPNALAKFPIGRTQPPAVRPPADGQGGRSGNGQELHRPGPGEESRPPGLYLRPLAQAQREDPTFQAELARGYQRLGDFYRAAGRPREAGETYRDSLAILQPLASRHSAIPAFQCDLARTYHKQGLLCLAGKDRQGAEVRFREALLVWEKLNQGPGMAAPVHAIGLWAICNQLGELARENRRPEEALSWHTRALSVLESAARDPRRQGEAREALRNASRGRVEIYQQLGNQKATLGD